MNNENERQTEEGQNNWYLSLFCDSICMVWARNWPFRSNFKSSIFIFPSDSNLRRFVTFISSVITLLYYFPVRMATKTSTETPEIDFALRFLFLFCLFFYPNETKRKLSYINHSVGVVSTTQSNHIPRLWIGSGRKSRLNVARQMSTAASLFFLCHSRF